MKGDLIMKKKLLSAVLALTVALPAGAVPILAEETGGAAENTLTVTYSPSDYVIRYGGKYSHTEKSMLAVNRSGITTSGTDANVRTDQDDMFSQYIIAAPNTVKDIKMNVSSLTLKDYKIDVANEDGTTTQEEAVLAMSIRYKTGKTELPSDGLYYMQDENTPVGGTTADEVSAVLTEWSDRLFFNKENYGYIINEIKPSAFGITDAPQDGKKYNVTMDITDTVLADLKQNQTEDSLAYFNVSYAFPGKYGVWYKGTDYYINPVDTSEVWAKTTTLDVIYDTSKILEDINSASTVSELKAKINTYAPMFGCSKDDFKEKILAEKLEQYVGKTFTVESFKAMLNSLKTIDRKTLQLDISDKFNYSNWGKLGEEITIDTFDASRAGNFLFPAAGSSVETFTLNAIGGDVIEFTFDKKYQSANVNNLYNAGKENSFTFEGFAPYSKKVYMALTASGNHNMTLVPVVTYTDGTQETKKIVIVNVGQSGETIGYCGKMYMGTPVALGANTWYQAVKSSETNGNGNYTVASESSSGGIGWYSFEVDSTKTIKDITFANVGNTSANVFAVGATVMSNEELQNKINDTLSKITEVSAENAETVLTAKKYAEELMARNVNIASDFAELNALVEEAEWYEEKTDSQQNMIDLTSYFNKDYIAPLGSVIANEIPSSLNSVADWGWKNASNTGGSGSIYADGVTTVNEAVYTENDDGTYTFATNGKSVKFKTPAAGFEAGVKDVIHFVGTDKITVPSSGKRVEKLYFLWDACGSSISPKVTVNYKDGTSETTTIYMCGYSWGWASGDNKKNKLYPHMAGAMLFGYPKPRYTEANGDGTYTLKENENGANVYGGLNIWYLDVDSAKETKSYVIDNAGTYNTFLYAMTEKTMANEDMEAFIAKVNEKFGEDGEYDYIKTAEDAAMARKAAEYAKELDARHSVKIADNQYVMDLAVQAAAQEETNLDLSAQANEDIIVKSGDTEKYASREDSLLVDLDEYITVAAPSNGDYTDADSGRVFKLFGNGKGNDAVKVVPKDENGEGITIDLDEKMYKRVSFLVDSIDTDVNPQTGATIRATVTYADGTDETVESAIYRSDSWYTNQQAAHFNKTYGSWDGSKYVNTPKVQGNNSNADYAAAYPGRSSEGLSAFGFDITTKKAVTAIKILPHDKAEFAIVAANTIPYTNEEEVAIFEELVDLDISETSEVTKDNAQTVIDGFNAVKDLYTRKYLPEETVEFYKPLYNQALAYDTEENVLKFIPSVSLENGNAVAKVSMVNTTASDEDYVLIIAAYDANNQLTGVKATEQSKLKSMTYNGEDSISMPIPANSVKYKAFVWESIKSMNPIAVAEK